MHGGWVDTVTVTDANPLLNGMQAIWLFKVNVSRTFDVSGFNGFDRVELEPYINQMRLPANTPGYDDGQFNHLISTDRQHSQWQLGVPFVGASAHTGFVDTATFTAEITLGTPFDLGIFALGWAAAGSNSASQSIGSTGEFGGTVTWGGSAGLTGTNGISLGAFDVTSLSGPDWVQPVPIPALAWLVALCGASLAGCRRIGVHPATQARDRLEMGTSRISPGCRGEKMPTRSPAHPLATIARTHRTTALTP